MPNYDKAQDVIKNGKEYLQKEGADALQKGTQEVRESGKDWWCYVEGHPIQSMIFGVIGYFALKGLFKN